MHIYDIEKAMDSGIVSQQAKVDAEQRRIEESDRYGHPPLP